MMKQVELGGKAKMMTVLLDDIWKGDSGPLSRI